MHVIVNALKYLEDYPRMPYDFSAEKEDGGRQGKKL